MNFIKSFFSKPPSQPQQKIAENKQPENSILDPTFTQVRLRDIKALSRDMKKLDQILKYQPESVNEQLKVCYTLHTLLSSDQGQSIEKVVNHFENHQIKLPIPNTQSKTVSTQHINQTCQIVSDQQMITQFQNSMFLNVSDVKQPFIQQIQLYEQINQNETEFMNIYYNYIQRISQNCDLYNACKFHQYPYQDEANTRKLQFLWLFKIINLLNFKLSIIPYLEFQFKHKSQNTPIMRDIAYIIYKDCLLEYGFLRNEITDMVEAYLQFQVKEMLQFYEFVIIMFEITRKMKIFYDMRLQFALNSASVRDIKWFILDKKQMLEIENYTSKAKLLNTQQFRKSLMIPTQKHVMENLQKVLQDPSLLDNSDHKEPITAKNNRRINELLYSPLNLRMNNKGEHSRQLSNHQQII